MEFNELEVGKTYYLSVYYAWHILYKASDTSITFMELIDDGEGGYDFYSIAASDKDEFFYLDRIDRDNIKEINFDVTEARREAIRGIFL